MHPGLTRLLADLRQLRETAGLKPEDVETALVLGPGWVDRFEQGEVEPSIGTLAALLDSYGSDLSSFFAEVDLGDTSVVMDRHLAVAQDGKDLLLNFPMGNYPATIRMPDATVEQCTDVVLVLRNALAREQKAEGIVECFLEATRSWPHVNPSDLWYFLVSHAYQDDYNHPAREAGKDWAQSWRRASGWALEAILSRNYNPFLASHGIRLDMPTSPAEKSALMVAMGVAGLAGVEKADVIAMGQRDGEWEPFGVIHVKASFAERRTDDVPLSTALIARGYASPLVTMDCKAMPGPTPVNRGELGPVQGGAGQVSSKRLDIERDRKFDACFVYNTNSLPTPEGSAAAARIHLCDFRTADDAFSKHLVRKWRDRQGLE